MNDMISNSITSSAGNSSDRHEIDINITRKAFDGLARQGMLFHQGLHELCDNALAAALPGEKVRICVALAADSDKNYLQLAVADWGERHGSCRPFQRPSVGQSAGGQ